MYFNGENAIVQLSKLHFIPFNIYSAKKLWEQIYINNMQGLHIDKIGYWGVVIIKQDTASLLGSPLLKYIEDRHINNLYNDHSEKHVCLFFKCSPFMRAKPQGIQRHQLKKTKSVYFKYFKQKGKQKTAVLWHDSRGTKEKKPLTQNQVCPKQPQMRFAKKLPLFLRHLYLVTITFRTPKLNL